MLIECRFCLEELEVESPPLVSTNYHGGLEFDKDRGYMGGGNNDNVQDNNFIKSYSLNDNQQKKSNIASYMEYTPVSQSKKQKKDIGNRLVRPCACKGTQQHVHVKCLCDWISKCNKWYCTICQRVYNLSPSQLHYCVVKMQRRGVLKNLPPIYSHSDFSRSSYFVLLVFMGTLSMLMLPSTLPSHRVITTTTTTTTSHTHNHQHGVSTYFTFTEEKMQPYSYFSSLFGHSNSVPSTGSTTPPLSIPHDYSNIMTNDNCHPGGGSSNTINGIGILGLSTYHPLNCEKINQLSLQNTENRHTNSVKWEDHNKKSYNNGSNDLSPFQQQQQVITTTCKWVEKQPLTVNYNNQILNHRFVSSIVCHHKQSSTNSDQQSSHIPYILNHPTHYQSKSSSSTSSSASPNQLKLKSVMDTLCNVIPLCSTSTNL